MTTLITIVLIAATITSSAAWAIQRHRTRAALAQAQQLENTLEVALYGTEEMIETVVLRLIPELRRDMTVGELKRLIESIGKDLHRIATAVAK